MAVDLLINGSSHRVAHDLESVLYVLLFICTHLKGPFGERRHPPLYGGDNKNGPGISQWLRSDLELRPLGDIKSSHIMLQFEPAILDHISPYFEPLKEHIINLWKAIISIQVDQPQQKYNFCSSATPCDIIKVFKMALLDTRLIEDAKSAAGDLKHHNKRSHPGDLVADSNCWDAVKPPTKPKKPKLAPVVIGKGKFLTRGTRKK